MRDCFSYGMVALAVLVLSGCASLGGSGGGEYAHLSADELISKADEQMASGHNRAAIDMLHAAADKNPVDARPWLGIAQAQFEDENYVDALVASQEALGRNPQGDKANGITFVSSLRLAQQALNRLSNGLGLQGTIRQQAQQLAQELRGTLGQDELFPESATTRSTRSTRTAPATTAKTRHATTTNKPSGQAASASTAGKTSAEEASDAEAAADQSAGDDHGGSFNPFESLQNLAQ